MNGPHDVGGSHGFGRVPVEDGEAFHAEWEKRVFGMLIAMGYLHRIPRTVDESRFTIERLPPDVYLGAAYFERWLLGGETNLERYGVLSRTELGERRRQLANEPAASPPRAPDAEQVGRVLAALRAGPAARAAPAAQARFAPGDAVVARNMHPKRHTRHPRYIRGKRGRIDRVHGVFDLPELAAEGESEPEYVYEVRFEGSELWGESAEAETCVYAQLWESYLESA
jgi:nitrile hydratase